MQFGFAQDYYSYSKGHHYEKVIFWGTIGFIYSLFFPNIYSSCRFSGFGAFRRGTVCNQRHRVRWLGEAGAGVYPKDFYKFDPALNQWTPIADFPGAGRETGIAYSVNGKGYVGLGVAFENTGTTVFNDFWRYDPTNNTWNQLGNFEGGARSKAAVYVLNGSAYVGTGANDQFVFLSDWWKYDPGTDNWTIQNNLGNLPPRYGAVAVVADNKAYLVGGRGNGGAFF